MILERREINRVSLTSASPAAWEIISRPNLREIRAQAMEEDPMMPTEETQVEAMTDIKATEVARIPKEDPDLPMDRPDRVDVKTLLMAISLVTALIQVIRSLKGIKTLGRRTIRARVIGSQTRRAAKALRKDLWIKGEMMKSDAQIIRTLIRDPKKTLFMKKMVHRKIVQAGLLSPKRRKKK